VIARAAQVQVDESALTGEAHPVRKAAAKHPD
jgi:magnesium-transporting ATPase (P-type)